MKKNYILLLALTLWAGTLLDAQDRNVVWVHGFLGDSTSWEVYDDMFAFERKMNTTRVDYSINNDDKKGFSVAANVIKTQADAALGANATNAQNIFIGHSLGGLSIRELQRQLQVAGQPNRFGGFITVGSSNGGAGFANSILNGDFDAYVNHANTELKAGPLIDNIAPSAIQATIAGVIVALPKLWEEFSSFKIKLMQPIQSVGNSNALIGTLTDLSVNSTAVNQLNAHSPNIPRIAIVARENSPVHWRTMSSLMTGKVTGGTMNDEVLPKAVSVIKIMYRARFHLNNTLANKTRFLQGTSAFFRHRANQWNRGIVWMDNSEEGWLAVQGCVQTVNVTTTQTTYLAQTCNNNFQTGSTAWQNCIIQQCGSLNLNNCYQTTTTVTTPVIQRSHSDGIVCENKMSMPGACTQIQVLGVNHFEQRNTTNGKTATGEDEMRKAFNRIWQGQNVPACANFFITPTRN